MVAHNDSRGISRTDEIPADTTYTNQTYTIYLAPVTADIYYQVKLEDKYGKITETLVVPTSLSNGEGHEGQALTDVEKDKWRQLLQQYATYTTKADQNGQTVTYRLVASDDPNTHLQRTDNLPKTFDNQTYTIYLVKDHESIPWTPLTPANVTMHYRVVIEDQDGQVVGQPLTSGDLGTGQEGTTIGNDVTQKWDELQKTWSTYTTAPDEHGKTITYKLVPAGHRTDRLKATDSLLPDYELDHLYTVYLVKDHESIPWTPLTPAQPTPQPEPKPQPQPLPVPQSAPSQPTDGPTTATNGHVIPLASAQQQAKSARLPQTGNDQHVGLIGLGMMALLIGLGLAGQQRRHDD